MFRTLIIKNASDRGSIPLISTTSPRLTSGLRGASTTFLILNAASVQKAKWRHVAQSAMRRAMSREALAEWDKPNKTILEVLCTMSIF